MKHLQLTPPLLIVTMGLPGAGKSFFARQFAEANNIARVSQDRLRFELFENPTFSEDENLIIERVMLYFLGEAMQTEHTIVCEGTFLRSKERKSVYDLATQKGYRTMTVWLQTDEQTALYRATTRDKRNVDSKHSFAIDQTKFEQIKKTLQRPTEKEEALVISGKHAYKSQSLAVLRKIANTYSDSLSRGEFSVQPTRPNVQVRPGRRMIQ